MHNNMLFIITNIYKYYDICCGSSTRGNMSQIFCQDFKIKAPLRNKWFPSTDTLIGHLIEMDTGRVESSLKGK